MQTDKAASERATAFHEAGHAVAYYALSRPFESVSILPVDSPLYGSVAGHVKALDLPRDFPNEYAGDSESLIHDHIVIALAGPVAEAFSLGTQTKSGDEIFDMLTQDDDRAIRLAVSHGGAKHLGPNTIDITELVERFKESAVQVVSANWGAVQIVARSLLTRESKTLEAKEVWLLSKTASRTRPPTDG